MISAKLLSIDYLRIEIYHFSSDRRYQMFSSPYKHVESY